jgi:hypothetical protein
MVMSRDSYPAQARAHDRKQSIAFFTLFDLNTKFPVTSSITDSIMADGSEFGANSGKLIYSPARAARYVFLDTRAPLGNGIGISSAELVPCWTLATWSPASGYTGGGVLSRAGCLACARLRGPGVTRGKVPTGGFGTVNDFFN